MKTEETIIQKEETQVVKKATPKVANEVIRTKVDFEENDTKSEGVPTWQKVVIGGVAGIALGTGAVFAASKLNLVDRIMGGDAAEAEAEGVESLDLASDVEQSTEDVYVGNSYMVDGDLSVAELGDNLSFSEAFAEAREQVGPGGVFEWNGGIYGTYYADEWDNMSAEERADFGSHITYLEQKGDDEDIFADNVDVTIEQEIVVVDAEVATESYDVADAEVQVLGVTEEILDDGSVATIGHVEVEGQDVFLIDTDQDGQFDLLISDVDGDGSIASNEYADIKDDSLSVDMFEGSASVDDQYVASNEPDYTNDDFNLV